MKVTLLLLLAFVVQVNAKVYSQQKVSLEYENVALSKVMKALERQTDLYFFYNDRALDTKQLVTVSVQGEELETVLQRLFGDAYTWEIVNNMIVLKPSDAPAAPQQQEVEERKVAGVVTDESGQPLPGVAVVLKGTTMGTSTDIDGKYTLTLPEGNYTLVFSMLGMSVREELVGDRTEINVVMHEEVTEIDEVVVTGIFKKARESYTGAVSTIDGEDLQMFRGQNLVQTLKNMDISINLMADNINGSNPNRMPQINIRGNSSLPMDVAEYNQEANNSVNTPLIIMDGFEIALERLMDYNDEEIESINILKDAAATAIYGSDGANGVIVIVTKEPEPGKLRVNAEVGIDMEVPDLTSYDLLSLIDSFRNI